MASGRNGTLYIGVTSDLTQRIWEHWEKAVDGFSKQYGVNKLVWFEQVTDAESAIRNNPYWRDLYDDIVQ